MGSRDLQNGAPASETHAALSKAPITPPGATFHTHLRGRGGRWWKGIVKRARISALSLTREQASPLVRGRYQHLLRSALKEAELTDNVWHSLRTKETALPTMFLVLFSIVGERQGKEGAGGAAAALPAQCGEVRRPPPAKGPEPPKPPSGGRRLNGPSPGLEPQRDQGTWDGRDQGRNPAPRLPPQHSP